jgi:hypothetical protein
MDLLLELWWRAILQELRDYNIIKQLTSTDSEPNSNPQDRVTVCQRINLLRQK